MDANAITQIIGSLGFPIAACVGLGYYIKSMFDSQTASMKKMIDRYASLLDSTNQTVADNTKAITVLTELVKQEDRKNDN